MESFAGFNALTRGCGLFDLNARARIRLTGGDRVRWLNGMVTNNIRDLQPGRGVYAFALNPQGRVLGDLYAFNHESSLMVETERSQRASLLQLFDKFIIMDDVEVADVSDELIGLMAVGAQSGEVLGKVGMQFVALEPLQFVESTWSGSRVMVTRGDNPKVDSYEVWGVSSAMSKLREALLARGAQVVSAPAMELLRVASGIPRYGQDIRERDLPQETEQTRALHFSKGCYVGQEIVERIRSRGQVHRTFTGFEVTGPLPSVGSKIRLADKDVGEVTSVASVPLADREVHLALGYIRKEAGRQFTLSESTLTIATLPFEKAFEGQPVAVS